MNGKPASVYRSPVIEFEPWCAIRRHIWRWQIPAHNEFSPPTLCIYTRRIIISFLNGFSLLIFVYLLKSDYLGLFLSKKKKKEKIFKSICKWNSTNVWTNKRISFEDDAVCKSFVFQGFRFFFLVFLFDWKNSNGKLISSSLNFFVMFHFQ